MRNKKIKMKNWCDETVETIKSPVDAIDPSSVSFYCVFRWTVIVKNYTEKCFPLFTITHKTSTVEVGTKNQLTTLAEIMCIHFTQHLAQNNAELITLLELLSRDNLPKKFFFAISLAENKIKSRNVCNDSTKAQNSLLGAKRMRQKMIFFFESFSVCEWLNLYSIVGFFALCSVIFTLLRWTLQFSLYLILLARGSSKYLWIARFFCASLIVSSLNLEGKRESVEKIFGSFKFCL